MMDGQISPAQIRAARALLGWTQRQLARSARVGLSTIKDAEIGKRNPMTQNVMSIRKTLENGGVEFTAGPGVRFRPGRPEIIRRPFSIGSSDALGLIIRWNGRDAMVQISYDTLNRIDGSDNTDWEEYSAAFRRKEDSILRAAVTVLGAGRTDGSGFVQLSDSDFEISTPRP
jgi:transcriptional regulator with XRE-family HTH domain